MAVRVVVRRLRGNRPRRRPPTPRKGTELSHQASVREVGVTGAKRNASAGKGRFDLLPTRAIREVAVHYESGDSRFGDRNWERGMPLSWFLDSGLRHAFQALQGENDENHGAAAAWNLLCFLETRARIKAGLLPAELDDLPKPGAPARTRSPRTPSAT